MRAPVELASGVFPMISDGNSCCGRGRYFETWIARARFWPACHSESVVVKPFYLHVHHIAHRRNRQHEEDRAPAVCPWPTRASAAKSLRQAAAKAQKNVTLHSSPATDADTSCPARRCSAGGVEAL